MSVERYQSVLLPYTTFDSTQRCHRYNRSITRSPLFYSVCYHCVVFFLSYWRPVPSVRSANVHFSAVLSRLECRTIIDLIRLRCKATCKTRSAVWRLFLSDCLQFMLFAVRWLPPGKNNRIKKKKITINYHVLITVSGGRGACTPFRISNRSLARRRVLVWCYFIVMI